MWRAGDPRDSGIPGTDDAFHNCWRSIGICLRALGDTRRPCRQQCSRYCSLWLRPARRAVHNRRVQIPLHSRVQGLRVSPSPRK